MDIKVKGISLATLSEKDIVLTDGEANKRMRLSTPKPYEDVGIALPKEWANGTHYLYATLGDKIFKISFIDGRANRVTEYTKGELNEK